MAISVDQFVRRLVESSLMSAEDVTAIVDSLPTEKKPQDSEQLARELVRQKKLTAYQAQQVYAGKGKSLVFGEYRVLDKLGQGGMGVVLKAEHRRMKRLVAVKTIAGKALGSPDAKKRFYREVEAAATFDASEPEPIVGLPLLVVRQDRIGLGGLFELGFCLWVSLIAIGVKLQGSAFVGLADIIGGSILRYAEDLVVVALVRHLVARANWPRRS